MVKELDSLDGYEEFESHFPLPSVQALELFGCTAHGLQSIQLLHLSKPIPLTKHVDRYSVHHNNMLVDTLYLDFMEL